MAVVPRTGEWTTGLCGCFEDCGLCCLSYYFPCMPFGQIANIIDQGKTPCWLAGTMLCVLSGCAFFYTTGFRTKLRHKYGLPEEPCGDCCVSCCCPFCAITQHYRELKNRGIEPALGYENVKQIYDQAATPAVAAPPVQQMTT